MGVRQRSWGIEVVAFALMFCLGRTEIEELEMTTTAMMIVAVSRFPAAENQQ